MCGVFLQEQDIVNTRGKRYHSPKIQTLRYRLLDYSKIWSNQFCSDIVPYNEQTPGGINMVTKSEMVARILNAATAQRWLLQNFGNCLISTDPNTWPSVPNQLWTRRVCRTVDGGSYFCWYQPACISRIHLGTFQLPWCTHPLLLLASLLPYLCNLPMGTLPHGEKPPCLRTERWFERPLEW